MIRAGQEAHRAADGLADLDVGDLGHVDRVLAAPLVGDPERAALGQRLVDLGADGVLRHVVGQLDLELPGGLGQADAKVHGFSSGDSAAGSS